VICCGGPAPGGPDVGSALDETEIELYFQYLPMKYLVVVLCALVGCGVSLPTATVNDASRANVQLADLQSGRSLLVSKCGSCHRPPMPADERARDWPKQLDEMTERANVDVAQRHLIEEYLVTMANR